MLKPLTLADAAAVARGMRDVDRREICALTATDDPVQAIRPLQFVEHVGVTAWHDARPVAACGAMMLHPGVVSAFMFATDEWRKVAAEVTKWGRHKLLPALYAAGCHRVQAPSSVEHVTAHRWMTRAFGARQEAVLRAYGKNGEDFLLFVIDRDTLARFPSVVN